MASMNRQQIIDILRDGDWQTPHELAKIGESAVDPLIAALDVADQQVRSRAIRALGEIGSVRAVQPLTQAMGDVSWEIRFRAACALGQIGHPKAIESLIDALGDENGLVSYAAVGSLAQIGEPAIEPLDKVLHSSNNEQMREKATEALSRINNARSVV